MRCVFCKHEDTSVVDSRLTDKNNVKRRRECKVCGKRFNTFEQADLKPIIVEKKNGTLTSFDRNKIQNGIVRALKKRNCTVEQIENIVDNIEIYIRENFSKKITSAEIGDIILKNLLDIDEVAYVRFASVYNKFDNLDSFIEIINKIKKNRNKD